MKVVYFFAITFLCVACNNDKGPDVSGIPVDITIHRFDKFLFEKVDTNNISEGLVAMEKAFPFFTRDFLTNILGLPASDNGVGDSAAVISMRELKRFIRLSRPLYDSISPKFSNLADVDKSLTESFKYVKYYYPTYPLPQVVTYVGPFDAPAVAITPTALAIGLQLYGGRNFSFYTSNQGQELYPVYISRRFEPAYVTPNCMRAVVEDLYPDQGSGKPLIEQMITKGKQWYLLDKFLPATADSLKTGYTKSQMDWCRQNEGLIWNYFLQNNDLYTTEPFLIKNFIGESPTTDGMPSSAPGNIGHWVGWQIVNAYAANHTDLKPIDIMKTDPKIIFKESKYKPR